MFSFRKEGRTADALKQSECFVRQLTSPTNDHVIHLGCGLCVFPWAFPLVQAVSETAAWSRMARGGCGDGVSQVKYTVLL